MKRTELQEKFDKGDPEVLLDFGLGQLQKNYQDESSCYGSTTKSKNQIDEAMDCIMKAVEQEYPRAYYEIGVLYHSGKYPFYQNEMDSYEAVRWYKAAAEKGYSTAHNALGRCFQLGNGTSRNQKKAFYHYRSAAIQNHPEAQNNLGLLYFLGKGAKQSFRQAFKWMKLASEQNFPEAFYNMGWFYEKGVIVPKDYKQAAKFYKIAADYGLACAQYKMSVYCRNGYGVRKNMLSADEWFNKLKGRLFLLGFNHLDEMGVIPDHKEAFYWLYKAAIEGSNFIYDDLSYRYLKGDTIEKSYVKSLKFLLLAKHYRAEQTILSAEVFTKLLPASVILQVVTEANEYLGRIAITDDEEDQVRLLKSFIDSDINTKT